MGVGRWDGEVADVQGANSSPLEASKESRVGGTDLGASGGPEAWLPTYLGQAAEWLVGE